MSPDSIFLFIYLNCSADICLSHIFEILRLQFSHLKIKKSFTSFRTDASNLSFEWKFKILSLQSLVKIIQVTKIIF